MNLRPKTRILPRPSKIAWEVEFSSKFILAQENCEAHAFQESS